MRTIRIKIIWVILLNLIVLQMYSQGLLFRNTDGIIDVVMSKTVTSIVPTDNQNGLNLILKDGSKKVYSSYSLENLETFNFQENITALNITYGTVSDVTSESATIKGISTNFTLNLSSSYTIYVLYGKANNLSPDYSLNAYATTTNRTCDIKLNKLSPSTQYYYQTLIKVNGKYYTGEVKSFTTEEIPVSSYCPDSNHPHVIDLGLPSGTKWACCNVGANTPEQYGDYYAWGETTTKNSYEWENNKYYKTIGSATKYNDEDKKTVLDLSDDVAYHKWGNSWRMPLNEEFLELANYCTIEYTTLNGINICKFTGANNNSICIPLAGWKGSELFRDGVWMYCWSASSWSRKQAFALGGWNWGAPSASTDDHDRGSGFSVRPVCSSSVPAIFTNSAHNIDVASCELEGAVSHSNTTKSYTVGFFISTYGTPSENNYTKKITYDVASPAGVYSISATGLSDGTKYYFCSYVLYNGAYYYGQVMDFTTIRKSSGNLSCPDSNHPHMIDLGLPSGTKWACCNVGASKPEVYGSYFAWGETETKESYNWTTYQWCNGSNKTLTKYNTKSTYGYVDNKTELESSDDAAYVKWGSNWRIPTYGKCIELKENCSLEFVEHKGVKGHILTGPSGKQIFFPETGYKENKLLKGGWSHYWSSTLDTEKFGPHHSWYFTFYKYSMDIECGHSEGRSYGYPIRPISK